MPFINIAVSGTTLSATQKQRLFDETTRLMAEVMKKKPELTAVRIDEYPGDSWAIACTPITASEKIAVHMDIKITDGTNTEEEKAEMIRLGMSMLKQVVGNTAEASYIVIHNLDSAAWGYDGKTQKARTREKASV